MFQSYAPTNSVHFPHADYILGKAEIIPPNPQYIFLWQIHEVHNSHIQYATIKQILAVIIHEFCYVQISKSNLPIKA